MSREPRRTQSEESQEGLHFKQISLDGGETVAIIEHPTRRSEWIESTYFVDVEQ